MFSSLSALLFSFAVLTGAVENPPEDLLSLGSTEKILTTLNVNQDEASLINILGGVTSKKKFDSAKLESAVKMLREGNSKDRRKAKQILNDAGPEALQFIKKLAKDSDPEVSETAKNIIKKRNMAAKAAQESGVTESTLKLLAIRRLTQLKSTKAVEAIKPLLSNKDKDIVREARRAIAILEGNKPSRAKRSEATSKVLELIPEKSGFAAVFDATEPNKSMTLGDYVKAMLKVDIPGMNADMITGQFDQFLPSLLTMVGNPQVDAVSMAVADDVGVERNSGWVGFIFSGSYDSAKMKKTLAMEFEPREVDGHKFFADKWGPSVYPVNDNLLIMSAGPNKVNHMAPFIKKLSNKGMPEKFNFLKETSKIRLKAMGDFSKEQREVMREELKKEMEWAGKRNGPDSEAQMAMIELALGLSHATDLKAVYEKEVVTFTGEMANDEKTKKFLKTVEVADEKMRAMMANAPIPMIGQLFDNKKALSKGSADGKKFTVKVKADFMNMASIMPFMFMAQMRMDAAEVQFEAQEAVKEAELLIEEVELEEPPEIEEE